MSFRLLTASTLFIAAAACGGKSTEEETTSVTQEDVLEEVAVEEEVAEADPVADVAEKIKAQTSPGVVILDPAADAIFPADVSVEKLTENTFQWSEGPVWIQDGNYLLFTDVPQNTMYKWSEAEGLSVFMKPSGLGDASPDDFREAGANGLIRGMKPGTILMGDHGNRAIAEVDLATKEKTFLVRYYQGHSLNSPNDLVLSSNNAIYFTDPPYGLAGIDDSPLKELPFNAVFRFMQDSLEGQPLLEIVDESLSKPNGILLSPDERTLYVAQSDPDAAMIFSYPLSEEGMPLMREMIFDGTPLVKAGLRGLPDGMAMANNGILFATGPGGIHVFDQRGKHLAVIVTGSAAANVTFGGDDGKTLYITSGAFLARVETNLTGLGF